MADRPHRAIVIFGDGLLIDRLREDSLTGLHVAETSVEAASCDALHNAALSGVSGFLALRNLASELAQGERVTAELAQLLDVYNLYKAEEHAADSKARWEDVQSNGPKTGSLPSLADRFMNLAGSMCTNSSAAAALAIRAGFSVIPLQTHTDQSEGLPSAKDLAERLVKNLGLDRDEERGPPPNAAQRSDAEFELAMVHVDVEQLIPANQVMTDLETPGETDQNRQECGGSEQSLERRWNAAVRGIEWMGDLLHKLQHRRVPGSKAAAHMLVALVLGYGKVGTLGVRPNPMNGRENDRDDSGGKSLDLPGVSALLPPVGSIPRSLAGLRPRQSYQLSGDKSVADVRDHHPLLVAHCLEGVTRRDDAQVFGVRECRDHGGDSTILADRFLHELAFKLWRAPKYGA